MRYLSLLSILFLIGCTNEEEHFVGKIPDRTNKFEEICLDGIVYYWYDRGIAGGDNRVVALAPKYTTISHSVVVCKEEEHK